jgi:PAS domain S-box-containing protein
MCSIDLLMWRLDMKFSFMTGLRSHVMMDAEVFDGLTDEVQQGILNTVERLVRWDRLVNASNPPSFVQNLCETLGDDVPTTLTKHLTVHNIHTIKGLLGEFVRCEEEKTRLTAQIQEQRSVEGDLLQMFDSLPHIIWTSKPDGVVDYVNKRWRDFTGLDGSVLGDQCWVPILHKDDIQRARDLYYETVRTSANYDIEYRFWDRVEQRYKWFLSRARPIYGADGKVFKWIGTSTDIEEQNKAIRERDALLESERMLREEAQVRLAQITAFVENCPLSVALVDTHMRYVMVGKVWAHHFSTTPAELVGKDHYALVPRLPESIKKDQQRILAGESDQLESEKSLCYLPGREDRWIKWWLRPWKAASGQILGMTVFIEDITETVRLQEQREKDLVAASALKEREQVAVETSRLKSVFLAHMTHELRTPCSGIVSMTSLLCGTVLTTEQTEYAEAIRQSSQALLDVINSILDLAKVEAGAMEIRDGEFTPLMLAEELTSIFKFTARQKGLAYHVAVPDGQELLARTVRGDQVRIRQALINLLGNAFKFKAQGSVELAMSAQMAGDDVRARFAVTDTGVGISPDTLKKLFQPFVQGDPSTSKHYGGTGLGLAISKGLVEAMGGTLHAASQEGGGSTFSFTLTLPVCEPTPPPTSETPPTSPSRPVRILVAEDNAINQRIVLKMLEKAGHDAVDVASNGEEAVAMTEKQMYDVVLMDCHMPQMDGYEATRRIHAALPRLPVIAITANALADDRDKCLAAGMDDYMAKPIDFGVLSSKIAHWTARDL